MLPCRVVHPLPSAVGAPRPAEPLGPSPRSAVPLGRHLPRLTGGRITESRERTSEITRLVIDFPTVSAPDSGRQTLEA
jgi:hypothetical protein